jgi:hypothetical protein
MVPLMILVCSAARAAENSAELLVRIGDWTGSCGWKLDANVGCALCMSCYMKAHKGTILRIAGRMLR